MSLYVYMCVCVFVSMRFQCLFEHLTYEHFRSLLWVGPALLFSTATAISVLGWDGKARTILSISMPNAGMYFMLLMPRLFLLPC